MDFSLSVEPSSSVLQPDGTDLAQSRRVSQHGAVQGATCVTDRQQGFVLIHIYSKYSCGRGEKAIVALVLWDLQAEFLLDCNAPSPQCDFQLSTLLQGGNLQFQQDVMS